MGDSAIANVVENASGLVARFCLRKRILQTIFAGASASLVALVGSPAMAGSPPTLPSGGSFVAGQGVISSANGTLSVSQLGANGIIDWNSFSIGAGNRVSIQNGAGATLNRVVGPDLSRISGDLQGTGSIYLINRNGVVVDSTGKVVTGGSFVASTRDIPNAQFMRGGKMTASGTSAGDVVNNGQILAQKGDVVMIGRSVVNNGEIAAPSGTVSMQAADKVLLTKIDGPGDVYVAAGSAKSGEASGDVTNKGTIHAVTVELNAAHGNVYALAGNHEQMITATGTKTVDGQVYLTAGQGTVDVTGQVTAKNADGTGGKIIANGRDVAIGETARLDAGGVSGGQILLGTSAPGGKDLADSLKIADGAHILAGGKAGGGNIETSGHHAQIGAATVEAGQGGQWLVDPQNLIIDTNAATSIQASLNSGTSVTEATTASGTSSVGTSQSGPGDIDVNAPISWTGTATLTLNAYNNIVLNAAITNDGSGSTKLNAAGNFINNAGAAALQGAWLVYSTNPALDTDNGLTPTFYQYNAPIGTAPAQAGANGFLYSLAPSLSVALAGTVAKAYDGTTAVTSNGGTSQTFSSANVTVTGLVNNDTAAVAGVYSQSNVGKGLSVTANNIVVTHGGVMVYGYGGTTPNVTAAIGEIDPKQLTATIIGNPTKVYNATNTVALTSANYQISGFAKGENAVVGQAATFNYAGTNAGPQTVNATLAKTSFTPVGSTSLSNYILPTTASGQGTITQAPLYVTGVQAQNKTYDGTNTDQLNVSQAALYGLVASDQGSVTLSKGAVAGLFATDNAGTGIAVSVPAGGFTISGTAAANYALVEPTGLSASIIPAQVSVLSGLSINNKVYDATTNATFSTSAAEFSGVVTGETATLVDSGATANFAQSNAGNNIAASVSGLTLDVKNAQGVDDSGNYTLVPVGGLSGNITPKPLSVIISSDPVKTYDGTTSAGALTGADFTVVTGIAGQSISIQKTIAAASYASPNALGQGDSTVTASLAVSDYVPSANTLLSNYELPTTIAGSGTIAPAPLTIALVGNPTKTYDDTVTATLTPSNYQITGFVGNEGATITQTAGTYGNANAGTQTVTVGGLNNSDFAPSGNTLLTNYTYPLTVSGLGTITPRQVTVNSNPSPTDPNTIYGGILGNPTKTYDGTTAISLSPDEFSFTGFVKGQGAVINGPVTGQFASANAGAEPVTANLVAADFSPANSSTNLSNYKLSFTAYGTGTIYQAPLSALILGDPTKTYNGTVSVSLTNGSLANMQGVGAGDVSSGSYQIRGLVAGESIIINSATNAGYNAKGAGPEGITATLANVSFSAGSGTLLSNYALPTQATGNGTITKAPLLIQGVLGNTKTYDGTDNGTLNTSEASLYGIVSGDSVQLSSAGATGNFNNPNAGSVSMTVQGFTISGADAQNYQLQQPNYVTATISQAPLSLNGVQASNLLYNAGTQTALTGGTLSGFVDQTDANDISLVSSNAVGNFNQSNVGNNLPVTPSGYALTGTNSEDYSIVLPSNLTANITPIQLTLQVNGNPTKVYDSTTSAVLPTSDLQLGGFINGQGATIAQISTASYNTANAGTNIPIDVTTTSSDFNPNAGTLLSNYLLPVGIGFGTITRAPLTAIIIGDPTKTYDTTTAFNATTANTGNNANAGLLAANYQISGFLGSDGATVSEAVGTYSGTNAGNQTIAASLAAGDFTATGSTNLSNYILPTSASGLATILQKPVTITGIAGTNRVYDGTTTDQLNFSQAQLNGVFQSDLPDVTIDASSTGTFASPNVGTGIAVTLSNVQIQGSQSGNYVLQTPSPVSANITPRPIYINTITKLYDGNESLPTADSAYTLSNVVGSDNVGVNASGIVGNYVTPNVTPGGYGSRSNYINVDATGIALTNNPYGNYTISPDLNASTPGPNGQQVGIINPVQLTVDIMNNPTKVYDGTTAYNATTTNAGANAGVGLIQGNGGTSNYSITGFVGTDTATIQNQPNGTFNSKQAGGETLTADLAASNYNFTTGLATNYILPTTASGPGTITPLTGVQITRITKVYDGGTTLPTADADYILSDILPGDNVSVNGAAVTGNYAGSNVGTGIDVTGVGNSIQLTGPDAIDYQLNSSAPLAANGDVGVITPATLTITGSRTYNGTDLFGPGQLTVATGVGNQTITLDGIAQTENVDVGTYGDGINGDGTVSLGNLSIANGTGANAGLASNYQLPSTAVLTINQAPLTVIGDNTAVTYNGTQQTNNGFTTSGTLYFNQSTGVADSVTSVQGYGFGTIVGNYADSLDNAQGTGLSNYKISYQEGSVQINQALLTIIGNTTVSTYNGTDQYNNYTVQGTLYKNQTTGVQDSVTGVQGLGNGYDVNTYIDALYGASGTGLSNYKIRYVNGSLKINPALLTVIGNTTVSAYNGAQQTNGFTVQGTLYTNQSTGVKASVTGVQGLGNGYDVNTYIDALYGASGIDLSNYNISYVNGSLKITPVQLTAVISGDPTKTYDGTTGATLDSNDYTLGGFVNGQGATVTQTTGTYQGANVGSEPVSVTLDQGNFTANSGTSLSNYILPTSAAGTGTINKAALTITGKNTVGTYNGTQQTNNGFTTSGTLYFNQTSGVQDSVVGVQGLAFGTNATTYNDSLSGAYGSGLSNYTITYVNGSLLINQAALTVIGDNTAVTYNGTQQTNNGFKISGATPLYYNQTAKSQDSVTSVQGYGFGTNVGNHTDSLNNAQGTDLSNYKISYVNGSVQINPALLTVIGNTTVSNYTGLQQTNGFTVQGTLYTNQSTGVKASVTGVQGSGTGTNVRTYDDALYGASGTDLSNYNISYVNGSLKITPVQLAAVISGNPTKTYDGNTDATLDSGDYTLGGFVDGQGATINQTTGTYAGADAGSEPVSATLEQGNFTANSGTLLSNYILPTSAAGTGTINQAALTITGVNDTDPYTDQMQTDAGYIVTGLVSGDAVSSVAGAAQGTNVGTYAQALANAQGTGLSNYKISYVNGSLKITPVQLTAVISGDPTKTYDGNTVATLGSGDYTLSGFLGGQGATINQTTGTYAGAGAGSEPVSATLGQGNFAANSGTLLSNYILPTNAAGTGTINQAALTITGADVTGLYTGQVQTDAGYIVTGLVSGDAVSSVAGAAQGTNVGTYAQALANAQGTGLANYKISYVDGSLKINPVQLTAVISGDPTKTYDGNTGATLGSGDYTLGGFVDGQGATINQTTGTYAGAGAGSEPVSATLGQGNFAANSGTLLSNYILPTNAAGTGTINQAALTITGADVTGLYTGQVQTDAGYIVTGLASGDAVSSVAGAAQGTNVGTYAQDLANAQGTGLANYKISYVDGSLKINPVQLTAVVSGNPTKTYDGNTGATLGSGDYTLGGFVDGQGATINQTTGTYAGAGAGSEPVSATLGQGNFAANSGTLLSNYILPTNAAGTGTINQAALTITGADVTGLYTGQAQTDAGYIVTGLVSGDAVSSVAGAAQGTNVGTYAQALANAQGTGLANYKISYVDGSLKINPVQLTAVVSGNPTKTYDGNTGATLGSGDYTLGGFVDGQGATINQTTGTYAGADAGSEPVSATLGQGNFAANSGTLLSNYILPTNAAGTGTINKAPLTIGVIGDPTKGADGNNLASLTPANYAVSGFVPGQGATINQPNGTYAGILPGSQIVTAGVSGANFNPLPGTNMSNYTYNTVAVGLGAITTAPANASALVDVIYRTLLNNNLTTPTNATRLAYGSVTGLAGLRDFIPYPAPNFLSTADNNNLAPLPSIVHTSSCNGYLTQDGSAGQIVWSGLGTINSTEQILLQGDKDKCWFIHEPRVTASITDSDFN